MIVLLTLTGYVINGGNINSSIHDFIFKQSSRYFHPKTLNNSLTDNKHFLSNYKLYIKL